MWGQAGKVLQPKGFKSPIQLSVCFVQRKVHRTKPTSGNNSKIIKQQIAMLNFRKHFREKENQGNVGVWQSELTHSHRESLPSRVTHPT